MTLDEAIQHCEEVAEEKESEAQNLAYSKLDWKYEANQCSECATDHRQLAEWLKESRVFKSRKGEWLRMSDLSEQEDDRYECSYCGNAVHYKNKMYLYTLNRWCGRCGSDNGRKIEVIE